MVNGLTRPDLKKGSHFFTNTLGTQLRKLKITSSSLNYALEKNKSIMKKKLFIDPKSYLITSRSQLASFE